MKASTGILDTIASELGVFISDLRFDPRLRRRALIVLLTIDVPDAKHSEWQEAMDYLLKEGAT